MSVELECIGCREIKTFITDDRYPVCKECLAFEEKRRGELTRIENETVHTCSLGCGYVGIAIQKHHIHGRKNSDETIRVCANCHVEIHKGAK